MNKYDAWIIRSLGVFVPVLTYVMFTILIDMRGEITHLHESKANKVNSLTLLSYVTIEKGRSEIVAELFLDFGRIINVREEELEPFRLTSIRKLNRSIKIGTTRGDN